MGKQVQTLSDRSYKRDKKLWIFNAGTAYQGNPKWLMEYILRYRKDISPVWMCHTRETEQYVKHLGRKAVLYHSSTGKKLMQKAGVYVVETCKEVMQPELSGIVILNLWHGVGCKAIERKVTGGSFLSERVAKKYIRYNDIYSNNQLFLVTSDKMKEHFMEQCGLDEKHLVCDGYPRNIFDKNLDYSLSSGIEMTKK